MVLFDEVQMTNDAMNQKEIKIKVQSEATYALGLGNSKEH